jgi:hypothetical protein
MLQKVTLPFGDGAVMDAVASAELYLGALALEDFQDELELELWGIRFGILLSHVFPFAVRGEDSTAWSWRDFGAGGGSNLWAHHSLCERMVA